MTAPQVYPIRGLRARLALLRVGLHFRRLDTDRRRRASRRAILRAALRARTLTTWTGGPS